MITLTIDDKTVTVPPGSTILFAANAAGLKVPTLCHDDDLRPYGACRICMVEVMGPQRRLVASCATPAANGMVIKTLSPPVIEARKAILEFLLLNHPLDCPVCDKAGDCRLQDLVHEYGLRQEAFAEEKRKLPPDHVSSVIERNTDRCILCGKCIRVCRERVAAFELAFTRRGGRSRVSTSCDRPLDCEFCGECVEVCPVGALATRQFKHRARVWNLEQRTSVCIYCGNGCPITLETDRGRVVRVRPGRNDGLCARGRFGWDAVHSPDRLVMPMIRRDGALVPCTWDEALSRAAGALTSIMAERGARAVGGLGSVRTTNEDNYVFQKFMRTVIGTNNVDILGRAKMPKGLNTSFFSAEQGRIGEADVILMLDRDAGEINPHTGREIVRAVNGRGRKLILVNSGHNKFNRLASVVLPHGGPEAALEDLLSALRSPAGSYGETDVAVALVCSGDSLAVIVPADLTATGGALLRELFRLFPNTTYHPVIRRGNLQGALDMGVMPDYFPGYQKTGAASAANFVSCWSAAVPETPGMNAVAMMHGIGTGALSALYIMGDDPVGSNPGAAPLLRGLDLLVVQDIFLTETAKIADVVLPAAGFLEKSGTITNLERRLQGIIQAEQPLSESRPDWQIIGMLARTMGPAMDYASAADIMQEIRSVVPLYRDLAVGECWKPEHSPLYGANADLSLPTATALNREVITSGRLLYSSGTMTTRSKEISSIQHDQEHEGATEKDACSAGKSSFS